MAFRLSTLGNALQHTGPTDRIMLQRDQRIIRLIERKDLYMRPDRDTRSLRQELDPIAACIIGNASHNALAVESGILE